MGVFSLKWSCVSGTEVGRRDNVCPQNSEDFSDNEWTRPGAPGLKAALRLSLPVVLGGKAVTTQGGDGESPSSPVSVPAHSVGTPRADAQLSKAPGRCPGWAS